VLDELTEGSQALGAEFQKEGHGYRNEATGTTLLRVPERPGRRGRLRGR
jgi:hypothetical protein